MFAWCVDRVASVRVVCRVPLQRKLYAVRSSTVLESITRCRFPRFPRPARPRPVSGMPPHQRSGSFALIVLGGVGFNGAGVTSGLLVGRMIGGSVSAVTATAALGAAPIRDHPASGDGVPDADWGLTTGECGREREKGTGGGGDCVTIIAAGGCATRREPASRVDSPPTGASSSSTNAV